MLEGDYFGSCYGGGQKTCRPGTGRVHGGGAMYTNAGSSSYSYLAGDGLVPAHVELKGSSWRLGCWAFVFVEPGPMILSS